MPTVKELSLPGVNQEFGKDCACKAVPPSSSTVATKSYKSMVQSLWMTGFHGFCMALADSVPGVSGGTIAFILGFYERLLSALQGAFGPDRSIRRQSLYYLAKLGLGWALGMIAANLLLAQIFELHVYFMSSLFLGLTSVSIPLVVHSEWETLKGKPYAALLIPIGAVMVFGLVAVRSSATPWIAINYLHLSLDSVFCPFFCGAIAICAMALPGISGSTLLMTFGLYLPTVYALRQVMALQFSYLPALLILAAGAVTGMCLFIRLLKYALQRHRAVMLYLVLGLMIGSLYAVWRGPVTLPVPQPALNIRVFSIPGFLLGVGLLLGLTQLQARAAK